MTAEMVNLIAIVVLAVMWTITFYFSRQDKQSYARDRRTSEEAFGVMAENIVKAINAGVTSANASVTAVLAMEASLCGMRDKCPVCGGKADA